LTAAPGRAGHRGLSDARVTREGPTISDVYYHKSTRCGGGVAPAIASGYKTCLRADPLHRSPITVYTHTEKRVPIDMISVQPSSRGQYIPWHWEVKHVGRSSTHTVTRTVTHALEGVSIAVGSRALCIAGTDEPPHPPPHPHSESLEPLGRALPTRGRFLQALPTQALLHTHRPFS